MPVRDVSSAPEFVCASRLLTSAYDVAAAVHAPDGPGRTAIEHPLAVATLLHEAGYPRHVVAAAILHDVVEDGGPDVATVSHRFGPHIGRLVGKLTEDASEPSFGRRKASLRQAAAEGHEAAAIFAADKLAILRALERGGTTPAREKLGHYERSLRLLRLRHPELPFLEELEAALRRLRSRMQ